MSLNSQRRQSPTGTIVRFPPEPWRRVLPTGPLTFAKAAALYKLDGKEMRFLEPIVDKIGSMRVEEITPSLVRSLAQAIYPTARPSTMNRQVVTPIRAVINHAVDEGLCEKLQVRGFKISRTKKSAVDREWIERFIAAAGPRMGAVCLFMFTTGARIGDTTALRWCDVDLALGRAILRNTKNRDDRSVQLTKPMIAMMQSLERRGEKAFGYASKNAIYGVWHRSCEKAGIAYMPPHQAGRHSFATEMIVRHGVDVATTAEAGGWKSVRLLLETYVHGERHHQKTLEVFGDFSPGAAGHPETRQGAYSRSTVMYDRTPMPKPAPPAAHEPDPTPASPRATAPAPASVPALAPAPEPTARPRRSKEDWLRETAADIVAVGAFYQANPGSRAKQVRAALPHLTTLEVFNIAEHLCRGMGFYREGQRIFYDADLIR